MYSICTVNRKKMQWSKAIKSHTHKSTIKQWTAHNNKTGWNDETLLKWDVRRDFQICPDSDILTHWDGFIQELQGQSCKYHVSFRLDCSWGGQHNEMTDTQSAACHFDIWRKKILCCGFKAAYVVFVSFFNWSPHYISTYILHSIPIFLETVCVDEKNYNQH